MSRPRRAVVWAVGLLALAFVGGFVLCTHSRLDRELTELPEPELRLLYERTDATLRSSCMRARGPMFAAYCREQAEFITQLPGCDRSCRDLAARFTPHPSR